MTAYVAMKELPLDKIVRAAPYHPIYGESLMGLKAGERVSVRDLLYGLILVSGNDAAHTLAVRAAGSQARFVGQMNRYAAALGLTDTHYANPVGLDEVGNYSSAADLATLARRLLQDPTFAEIADSRTALLRSLRPPRRIDTLNYLLEMAPWATGVKTGHTFDAGYVLVGSGEKKGVGLVSVAIGAPTDETRFTDNLTLLEYGFSQYQRRLPIKRGAGPRRTRDPLVRRAAAAAGRHARCRSGSAAARQIDLRVRAPREVEGPIRARRQAGHRDGLRRGTPGRSGAAARRPRDPRGRLLRPRPRHRRRQLDPYRDRGVRDTHGSGAAPVAPAHPRKRLQELNGVKAK